MFPNQELFATHMFQVRIKASPTVTINSCSGMIPEASCVALGDDQAQGCGQ